MIFAITDPACKQYKHAALGSFHFVLHRLQAKDITREVLTETLAEAQVEQQHTAHSVVCKP